ncbi:SPW repeat domain-containing protein [Natrinema marinum]|uniref:SPW repeat domain-containing protein n=1 Tax=Natrinema marinum TaxID=2961598 RepID=UPI0020C897FC|nr:hypothetical protein [Natrinema marinum]
MSGTRSADDASVLVERAAGLTAVLGAFIMVSAPIFTITDFMGLQNVLAGGAVAFVAALHAYWTSEKEPSIVLAVILLLLGVWIAAAPFVLGVDRALVVGINSLGGAIIAILSIVSAYGSVRASGSTTPSSA